MAFIVPLITVAATVATTVSSLNQAAATKAAAAQAAQAQTAIAAQQQQVAEFKARSEEKSAGQERAAAQLAASEQRRQGRFAASRVQALSAASGAGALDPTIIGILGDVKNESDYRAMTALYEGESRARTLETQAAIDRMTGQITKNAGDMNAAATLAEGDIQASKLRNQAYGTILQGSSSLYDQYARAGSIGKMFGFG